MNLDYILDEPSIHARDKWIKWKMQQCPDLRYGEAHREWVAKKGEWLYSRVGESARRPVE